MIPAVTGFWRGRKKPINNIIRFRTTAEGLQSFSVQLISLPETTYFDVDWGDGSPEEAFSTNATAINIAHEFLDDAEKEVTLTFEDIEHFGGFNFGAAKKVTFIDISNSLSLRYFNVTDPELVEIIPPKTVQTSECTLFYVTNSNLEILDMRNIRLIETGNGADIRAQNCSNLHTVLFPTESIGKVSALYISGCPLLQSLDLTCFDTLRDDVNGADIQLHANPLLSQLILPETPTGVLGVFFSHSNPLLEHLDLSQFTLKNSGTGSNIQVHSSGLKELIFNSNPNLDEILGTLRADNCQFVGGLEFPYRTASYLNISNNAGLNSFEITHPYNDLELRTLHVSNTGITGALDLTKIKHGYGTPVSSLYSVIPFIVTINSNLSLTAIDFHPNFNATHGVSLECRKNGVTGILDLSMFEFIVSRFAFGKINNDTNSGSPNLNNFVFSPTVKWDVAIFSIDHCDIQPTLDLSTVRAISTYTSGTQVFVDFGNNPNLEEIIFPDDSEPNYFVSFNYTFSGQPYPTAFRNMASIKEIDLSTYQGAGRVGIINCPKLEYIGLFKSPPPPTLAPKPNADTFLVVSSCPKLEEVYIPSTCSKLVGLSINAPIHTLSFPATQESPLTNIQILNTKLEEIDLSWATLFSQNGTRNFINNSECLSAKIPADLSYNLGVSGNTLLEDFEFSLLQHTIIDQFGQLNFRGCQLNADSIDKMLVDIDNMLVGMQIEGGRIIYIDQLNAAPTDGTITGHDGLSAKTSLINKGISVITN